MTSFAALATRLYTSFVGDLLAPASTSTSTTTPATTSTSTTAAPAERAESAAASSSTTLATHDTGAAGQLQGRGVYKTNPFSEWFSDGISQFTGLSRDFCFLIEGYMMDDTILERICYPAPNLPDRILLNDVFMKTIPLPFVPVGEPNPAASAMLEGVAKGSMQNLSQVNLGGVLLSFATAEAGRDDIADRIHAHLGRYITNFAPRLQSLTLQRDFRVTQAAGLCDRTQYQFDAACLKKHLPAHANVDTMTITLVSEPMTKFVVLDLTNRRLHSETTTASLI